MTEILFPYEDEIQEKREQDAQVKERYGLSSLDTLIAESNQKLMEYYARKNEGENMRLPIQNEEQDLERLERRKERLEREIELERNVNVEEPEIFGVAALLSASERNPDNKSGEDTTGEEEDTGDRMERNEEIEAVGMEVAQVHEESSGREVEDVSEEPHGGFDLRSIHYDDDGKLEDVRYIEAKARAQTGKIRLTSNEWKKARKFGEDYWIYVVTEAASDNPELTRIQNPAKRFEKGQSIYATGFEIPQEAWQQETSTE